MIDKCQVADSETGPAYWFGLDVWSFAASHWETNKMFSVVKL